MEYHTSKKNIWATEIGLEEFKKQKDLKLGRYGIGDGCGKSLDKERNII